MLCYANTHHYRYHWPPVMTLGTTFFPVVFVTFFFHLLFLLLSPFCFNRKIMAIQRLLGGMKERNMTCELWIPSSQLFFICYHAEVLYTLHVFDHCRFLHFLCTNFSPHNKRHNSSIVPSHLPAHVPLSHTYHSITVFILSNRRITLSILLSMGLLLLAKQSCIITARQHDVKENEFNWTGWERKKLNKVLFSIFYTEFLEKQYFSTITCVSRS